MEEEDRRGEATINSGKPPLETLNLTYKSGSGSEVGIATGHGLDSPGFETRWGRDSPHLSRPALEPTQPPVK